MWLRHGIGLIVLAALAMAMQIEVKTLGGIATTVDTEPTTSIRGVKAKLKEKTGIAIKRQVLLFAGQELDDTRTLSDYNIGADSTLHLIARYPKIKVGPPPKPCKGVNRRVARELKALEQSPPAGISAGPTGSGNCEWRATIMGPDDGPYAGGIFFFDVVFPEGYPVKRPYIRSKTKIFHTNVDDQGRIANAYLAKEYKAADSVATVLQSVRTLMQTPDLDNPMRKDAARLYVSNRSKHDQTAAEWTQKYAQ